MFALSGLWLIRAATVVLFGLSLFPSVYGLTFGFPYGSQKVRGVNLGGWLLLEVRVVPFSCLFFSRLLKSEYFASMWNSLSSLRRSLTLQEIIALSMNGLSVSSRIVQKPPLCFSITGTPSLSRQILLKSLVQGMFFLAQFSFFFVGELT